MSMGAGEGFKMYAQKWRDLAGRVQPPLSDRELVDMFLDTLSGPFFNNLIGSSSARFTELIMTGERVEAGIKSGKIQRDISSSTMKKPFTRKKEVSVAYDHRNKNKTESRPTIGAVMIFNPVPNQQRNYQRRPEAPMRRFTRINMTLSQVLPHLLKSNLVTLKEAPKNPNTASPHYNPNARCAYHYESPGHDKNDC